MVQLVLWVEPGRKVQEKAPSEKPLEREKAAQSERQVLEDQEQQGAEGAWVALGVQV